MRARNLLVIAVAIWMRMVAPSAAAAPVPTSTDPYCGDAICQDWGCSHSGNETPGNGCVEDETNCPQDCGYCGDNYCYSPGEGGDETYSSCPEDCEEEEPICVPDWYDAYTFVKSYDNERYVPCPAAENEDGEAVDANCEHEYWCSYHILWAVERTDQEDCPESEPSYFCVTDNFPGGSQEYQYVPQGYCCTIGIGCQGSGNCPY